MLSIGRASSTMFSPSPAPEHAVIPTTSVRRSPTLNPIADAVNGAMRAGLLRKDDVWEVALELWAVTHGYVTLHRAGRFNLSEKEFRALVRRALRRLIHGLKA